MDDRRRVEAAKGIISSLFASQRALRALAPEFKWTGLGNLLGDFGEFLAIHEYGLMKCISGSNGFDARTADGRSVQVKTNHSAAEIGFRGEADLLLVLHVLPNGEWEEIYFGPFAPVKAASRYSRRDNKDMITVSKLRIVKRKLQETGSDSAGVVAAEAVEEEQRLDCDNLKADTSDVKARSGT